MNRATTLATLAGLSLSATAFSQAQSGTSILPDPTKQPATPPLGAAPAKPKSPVKPSIVDLQDAAKQPRKRAPRTPSVVTLPAPSVPTPAVTPAPVIVPAPAVVQPLTPLVAEPTPTVQSKPAPTPVPEPEARPVAAAPTRPPAPVAQPSAVSDPTPGTNVSMMASTPAAQPIVDQTGTVAPTTTAVTGPVVDIESVAVKPVKGELRQSPVAIGAQESARSTRQPVPAESPAVAEPGTTQPAPETAPSGAINDQRLPNPAASLLPAAAAQSVLSTAFVDNLTSGKRATTTASEPEPSPVPAATIAAVEVAVPTAPTPALPPHAAVVEKSAAEPAPVETKPVVAAVKPVEVAVEAPKPLDVRPAAEPLPPLPPVPAPSAPTTPIVTKPVEPATQTQVARTPLPVMPVEVRPVEVGNEAVKPVEIKGPEVSPLDASKIKLTPAPSTVTNTEPVAAPVVPETQPVAAPIAQAKPVAPVATPAAPAAQPAIAGDPEPVSLKVLSLTGTPGMVQWQIDGGTLWLIPEVDESTKARFVVRTGPDAGVEMLVDGSTRVRLGRFSRAEVRTLDTTDDAGTGKRLNIQLMRGVVYVVPGKGQIVTVQTPARAVIVKEPTQVTHDNSGTRSVSFTEQPNPGTTATAPSANP